MRFSNFLATVSLLTVNEMVHYIYARSKSPISRLACIIRKRMGTDYNWVNNPAAEPASSWVNLTTRMLVNGNAMSARARPPFSSRSLLVTSGTSLYIIDVIILLYVELNCKCFWRIIKSSFFFFNLIAYCITPYLLNCTCRLAHRGRGRSNLK